MRLALSPGRRTRVVSPSIVSLPAGSMVKSPPPLLRTARKKLFPRAAAPRRSSVPVPVPDHTRALARSVTSSARGLTVKVVTGRDCESVLLVTVRP